MIRKLMTSGLALAIVGSWSIAGTDWPDYRGPSNDGLDDKIFSLPLVAMSRNTL